MTQKIILLDRNVYIEIEKKLTHRKYDRKRIRTIKKKYDQYEIFILPLSIIEGEKSTIETSEEKYTTCFKETEIVGKFFKKAKTFPHKKLHNKNINQELKEIFKDVFPDQKEDFINVKNFLNSINEKLQNDVSNQEYVKYEEYIIDTAISNQLSLYNPIVLCTIFVLHKNHKIRNIYKFGKDYDTKIYNVLSDFNVLKQQAMVKHSEYIKHDTKIELATFDESLKYLNKHLNIKLIDNSSEYMEYKITFPFQLLKDSTQRQSEEENSKIQKRIENYYKKQSPETMNEGIF